MKKIFSRYYRSFLSSANYNFLTGLLLISVLFSCTRTGTDEFEVIKGPFRQSIIETGELEAIKASVIIMPNINWRYGYQYKIVGLLEHGKIVHKGDSVVAIDPSSVHKVILTTQETLENDKATANRQRVQMENNIQELQAQLKNEQAAFDLKKLELERIRFESPSKQRIKELEFKQAQVKLDKVKRNLELKPKLEDLDLKIQKIKVRQRESEINNAVETLKVLTIRSPIDGVFQVSRSQYSGQIVRLGDNIYIGSKIASIPDINKMKVLSYVNETDIQKIYKGMKVIVRLDALPSVPFSGTIRYISKVCTDRENEKVFKTEIEIGESDLRLKPGMTVSCEYICHDTDTALYVPNNCVLKIKGHSYIFLDKGSSPRKTEVRTGPSNSHHTMIYGDLEPGQKLVPTEKIDIQKTNNQYAD